MVAYSFKTSFLQAIAAKEKQQTIRLPRKRHARAGERLQFFYGPRMRPVRIGGAVCRAAREVRLDFEKNEVLLDDAIAITGDEALNAFAIRDGFNPARSGIAAAARLAPWIYMERWWSFTHPGQPVFAGVLVDWGDSFEAAP